MMARKPDHESWGVLINEFGEVSVDHAAFDLEQVDESVMIREIPGGCMCCMMNVPMRLAITEILPRSKLDRLLIEPTGIGHPAGILDELRSSELSEIIDVMAVICLVDQRRALDPRIQVVEVFQVQVHLSDVLVASKADISDTKELNSFHEWALQLFPPKLQILNACNGELDLALLDLDTNTVRAPLFPDVHDHHQLPIEARVETMAVELGKPHRAKNYGVGYQGCGWIFSPDDIFDRELLTDLLEPPGLVGLPNGAVVERLKGVFRVGKEWVSVDRLENEVTVSGIAYRNDSRLEVITPEKVKADWDKLERCLLNCLQLKP